MERTGRTGVAVVGASLGGLRAAEQLRAAGWQGPITLFGDEPHLPYNRPPLSKAVLAGHALAAGTELRRRPSVEDVEWRLGAAVSAADLMTHTLTLTDGSVHMYEGLVAATGVRPRRLPMPGGPPRHVVRTLEDSAALAAGLAAGARVLVIGSGFIGCEVAATARTAGCAVAVVAPETEPMVLALGPHLARALRRRHEARGVRFHMGRLATELTPEGCVLDDGTELRADLLVEAIGSLPNTEWLAATPGLDLTDGILCDAHLRIGGIPHAVAVGDVARFPNPRYGPVPRRVEHWSVPGDTARHAARTLVATLTGTPRDPAPCAPLPSFWSDQYTLRLQSFGQPALADRCELLEGDPTAPEGDLLYAYYQGPRLIGVAALGGPTATAAAARHRPHLMTLPEPVT
ncbi:NAD(P)/FAD-dependent oxidoreductase [Streptomyces sp. PA5.6]|uniref:NAD(P)/FAD-dependent oxidoreductase n=1 Tax=Streptomyces sp. PA5.6 TaxID=3035651 RepID=UPI0039048978